MNLLQLRDKLTIALDGLIGTYQLPNNTTTPSVYVITKPLTQPVNEYKVSGLEVLIHRDLQKNPEQLSGKIVCDHSGWIVELVQHDTSRTLGAAIDNLIICFPRIDLLNHVPQTDLTLESAKLLVPLERLIQQISI